MYYNCEFLKNDLSSYVYPSTIEFSSAIVFWWLSHVHIELFYKHCLIYLFFTDFEAFYDF